MKVLKINEDQHDRIAQGAKQSGYSIKQFAGAMLDLALRKFESGEIKLAPVSAEELQPEEAA